MYQTLQPYLSEFFTAVIGAFVAWFFTRKKQEVDVKKQEADVTTTDIDNGAKVVDLYKSAMDDLGVRYEEKYKHIAEMSKNISDLFDAKEKVLLQEIEYHKKQTALYKKMYDDKVKEFLKYKKEHP
ncbi:conserved hypothetical protein [Flavobacterium psychrophilum]|uniref:hypothetical protein n=1 Tax=Flavobacterium psychrophilum TaxID=96345 RepID=UPI000B7C3D7D|nr:hypothetical protein [Flavobacterium psychrophilum]SNA83435.1 conserved hypothetical protein [Flavobacterium psychrophilum]